MTEYVVTEAEDQREGVLRLNVRVLEDHHVCLAVAVVSLQDPQEITVVSKGRHMPSTEGIKAVVWDYLREEKRRGK